MEVKAYVLMRVYNPYLENLDDFDSILNSKEFSDNKCLGSLDVLYYDMLYRAVQSVMLNGASLIIIDDSSNVDKEKWENHKNRLCQILEQCGFNDQSDKGDVNLFILNSSGHKGSAYAMWRLREYFAQMQGSNRDFAVLLDQDDELTEGAVGSIKLRMTPGAIVVSSYTTAGQTVLDITRGGEVSHTRSIRSMRHNRLMYPKLSTIGWTKSYSRDAMRLMVNDFNTAIENVNQFFKNNTAYEDFLDFYMLLNCRVEKIPNKMCTHKYYKHPNSITAVAHIQDFDNTRKNMLSMLVNICMHHHSDLFPDWKYLLQEFILVKISDIETILARYRADFDNPYMDVFRNNTWPGWFADKLCDNEFINSVSKRWDRVDFIYQLANMKLCAKFDIMELYSSTILLQNKNVHDYERWMAILRVIIPCLIIGIVTLFIVPLIDKTNLLENMAEVFAIIISALLAMYTFLRNNTYKLKIKIDEDKTRRKQFFSEFEDLLRHISANIAIVVKIRCALMANLSKDCRPEPIHFENLIWPEESVLFSSEMSYVIDKSKVDDCNRMKMNVRNMNNSARWLRDYSCSSGYNQDFMLKCIDWEVTRLLAYYINFMYMKYHDFSFATPKELNEFLSNRVVKKMVIELFGNDIANNEQLATYYLERYYRDRRIERAIVAEYN